MGYIIINRKLIMSNIILFILFHKIISLNLVITIFFFILIIHFLMQMMLKHKTYRFKVM